MCWTALLGQVLQGQRDWDMRNWDSGTGTGATRTAGLGHAELGQRDWDRRYRDNLFVFIFFCDMNVERKFFFAIVCNLIVVVVTNTTVESLR